MITAKKAKKDLVVFSDVPQFEQREFLYGDAPFRFIDSFRSNPFEMEQIITKVAMVASSVGIKNFKSLWVKYEASLLGREVTDINETDFGESFPLDTQLESGPYICNSDGVSIKDAFGITRIICPHPICPIRRYRNIDTGEELLEIWFRRGNDEESCKETKIIFSKSDISNGISKLAAYGIVVTRKNEKDLSAYLLDMENMNYGTLEERQSVKRLGWVGRGYKLFSPYAGSMFFDGEEDYGHLFSTVSCLGDYEDWKSAAKSVRKEKTTARIYLAASFASAILKPCGLLPFLVHSWGGTGNGKTVSLMLAASVWANPEMGEYVTSYNSTAYGLETTAGFLNSLPLCIDELQIKSSQGAKDFDSIIYQLCEGVSKKQGTASGGLRKQSRWRNVILSTGEHTIIKPLSGGGARNRVIEIEAPEKVYSDLVGLCEIISKNYGYAGKQFAEWLSETEDDESDIGDNMVRVQKLQSDYYHKLLEKNVTEKQAGSASAILAADHIATELIFQDGMNLTVDEISEHLLKKSDVDVNKKALEWLYDYIDMNPQHFDKDSKTEVWGWLDEDEGCVYFNRQAFNNAMELAHVDPKSFLSWAKRNNAIITNKGRTDLSVRQTLDSKQKRMICLKLGLVFDECSEKLVTNEMIAQTSGNGELSVLHNNDRENLCDIDELPF